jgi:hypothetical protein
MSSLHAQTRMPGMRFPTHAWRWICLLVALAVAFAGMQHVHAAGHAPTSSFGASVPPDGEDAVEVSHDPLAHACADAQLASDPCCMSAGGCASCVPVANQTVQPTLVTQAPRPTVDALAAGPLVTPLYRPPRLSQDA